MTRQEDLPEGVSVAEFDQKMAEALKLRDDLVEKVVKILTDGGADVLKVDPVQPDVPADYAPEPLKCNTVRDMIGDAWIHVVEEVYGIADDEPWFKRY